MVEGDEKDRGNREKADMNFTTKDSGKRIKMGKTEMVRDTNEGKARFDLLIPEGIPYGEQFLTRWAQLMARGAEKYGERNWELGEYPEAYWRAKESAMRHMVQWIAGDTDEDHAAAIVFNVAAAEFFLTKYRGRA